MSGSRTAPLLAASAAGLAIVGASALPASAASPPDDHSAMAAATIEPADRSAVMLTTAPFQDVATAEAAGYASTMDDLGCFENPGHGGMGLHYLNASLMDATVDGTRPEALVYELDATGEIAGLVAHEYIVPIDAWTDAEPPTLFGVDFHRHASLPLWVLHAWLWKDNADGMFVDWNPAVRMCPSGVPVFGAVDYVSGAMRRTT